MTTASPLGQVSDSGLSPEILRNAIKKLEALRHHKSLLYSPYPKQAEFHKLGLTKRERVLLAGNQLGKTRSAGEEASYHARGVYPDWWEGRRYTAPNHAWVACATNELVRDNPQKILLGPPGQLGTGTIPLSAIYGKPTMARGFPDLVDRFQVQHVSGGISSIQFKAYDQGRKRWQGATLDWLWLDEEPPEDVYGEAQARIVATNGMIFMSMTPLMGMSEVVAHFFPEPDSKYRGMVQMTIEDAGHLQEHEIEAIIASYSEHERDARARGYPMLGEGLIFSIPQSSFEVEAFEIPSHWAKLGGVDFGYGDHPFAAIQIAHDRDSDCVYVTHCYKEKQPIPAMHVSAIRDWNQEGDMVRYAWPHDGTRAWGESGPIKDIYAHEGLLMLGSHATFKTGGYSPEAAANLMLSRMQTGKLKIFAHLGPLFAEIASYHRKNGQIVPKKDDLISALMKAMMMLRKARAPFRGQRYAAKVEDDFDPFRFDE